MNQFSIFEPRSPESLLNEGHDILNRALQEHDCSHVFALFSGGHDSICSTHITSLHPAFSGVIHINTGIGIKQTREYVREICKNRGWPLKEYHPPKSYRELVLKFGFPGPGFHMLPYRLLKERAVYRVIRDHKQHRKDRIMLCTGVRSQESSRRMGTTQTIIRRGAQVWAAPIISWAHDDKWRYMKAFGLPENPVVNKLCMSGECLCGAFAAPGERQVLKREYPEVVAEIEALEKEARKAGVHAKWGTRPPTKPPKGPDLFTPLCVGCEARAELVKS